VRSAFILALVLAGCAPADSVHLLTGDDQMTRNGAGCYTNFAAGLLTADPVNGTRIADESTGGPGAPVVAVMWPPGFTARRSGGEVEVLDRSGGVIVTTGNRYQIEGGYIGDIDRVFLACGYVLPK
jgi:hypothetical protein